jgi:alpha-beta hydrolase superfamily lysophospholipase
MELLGASDEAPPAGESAAGLRLDTTRGEVHCLLHTADGDGDAAVLFAPGARGGFAGPGDGLYRQLAEELSGRDITSLRLDYRHAADLDESTLDTLAAVWHLSSIGRLRVALVGHSFGGGVVISAARYSSHVRAVVALSSQTMGAQDVVLLPPRPLLLVHGEADDVLPVAGAHTIYDWAFEPKRLVTYAGARHGLRECREELMRLLAGWLPESLGLA